MMLKVAILIVIVVILIGGYAYDKQQKEKQNITLLKEPKLNKDIENIEKE